jgi:hypothetical protein
MLETYNSVLVLWIQLMNSDIYVIQSKFGIVKDRSI